MTDRKDPPRTLPGIIDRLEEVARNENDVTVGTLMGIFGRRSFGPLILVPALLALGPTGVIPGMAIGTGALIILIAAQLLLRRTQPWLPRRVLDIGIRQDLVRKTAERGRPLARTINKLTRQRLTVLTKPPAIYPIAVLVVLLSALFFPLAFIPFGVAIPSFVLVVLSVGLTINDGIVVLVSLVLSAGAFAGAAWLLL